MNRPDPSRYIAWLPFFTLLQKEVRRFLRVASQTLVTPVITASLYLFIFGATLGERISVLEGFSYAQFVIPGLILMGIIELNGGNSTFLHVFGIVLIISRIAHAVGLKHDNMAHPGRVIGAGGTFLMSFAAAVYAIWMAVKPMFA